MTQKAPVEALLAVIPAPDFGADTYVNVEPLPFQQGVPFASGASLMGQSAMAAAATVPDAFQIYSMQSAFLRAVNGADKVYYHVERTSNGQTFCSRTVRATQGDSDSDACAYQTTVCFQRNDKLPDRNVLDYHVPMPHVGGLQPEGISKEKLQEGMDANISRSVPLLHISAKDEPFEWRPFDSPRGVDPTEFWERSFVRSPVFLSARPHLHQAALAWLSDTYTLGTALNANPDKVGKQLRNVAMGATLTNNVSFHEPMTKVDDWMLGERATSWGANGRAVITQRFWDVKSGRLVMSGTQEIVVRLRDDAKL
ncbi:thioesterase-like superfamily-domain-containing protein [Astrocystis sublimbata]|nr:thioesterase-like superfamily-domain-containing protein [Astrocystis sublimbata]